VEPHRIRLRKPWQCQPTEHGVVWHRRFGRPTGLGPAETVSLVVEGIAAAGTVELNGQPLGRLFPAGAPQWFNVTGKLAERNEVSIVLRGEADTAVFATATARTDSPGSVYLEIAATPMD
jgi:hypothetical protein